jgi:hypothetical protein
MGGRFRKHLRRAAITVLTVLALCWLYFPLFAQHQGPIAPPAGMTPPPSDPKPKSTPAVPAGGPMIPPSVTSLGPPSLPIDQIIQKFAAREAEFKAERDNYTYTQIFVLQTLDDSGRVDGEYRMTTDVVFTPEGKRYEKDVYRPVPTLERLLLTQEDFNDLEHLYPFVLTTEDLPKYDVKYVDHVPLDELTTYVFDMAPKTMEKNQRYFQGRIWVDDKDFQIVKTFGKPVGYAKKRKAGDEQLFPQFETFRENIEGKYWFPTYTRADEVLPFKDNPVHIRVTVRYENYKRFGVTVKIGKPAETDKNK